MKVSVTPNKVVTPDRCCSVVVPKKDKLYIFGKSLIDFSEIITSSLDVNLRSYSASIPRKSSIGSEGNSLTSDVRLSVKYPSK